MGLFALRGSSDEYDQKMHTHNTGTEGISEGTVIENDAAFFWVVAVVFVLIRWYYFCGGGC